MIISVSFSQKTKLPEDVIECFFDSLGLDPSQMYRLQPFEVRDAKTFRMFNMSVSMQSEELLKVSSWECCIDAVDHAYRFSINGRCIAAQVLYFNDLAAQLANLDADLKYLWVGKSALTDLGPLCRFNKLSTLILFDCPELTDLTPLSKLITLVNLDLSWCNKLTDFGPLSDIESMQALYIGYCPALVHLDPLASLSNLKTLQLISNPDSGKIMNLRPIQSLANLRTLKVSGFPLLTDISPLSVLVNITNLCFVNLDLEDVSPLSHLTNLTSLDISECNLSSDISSLSNIDSLKSLKLNRCHSVKDFSFLSQLKRLSFLSLKYNDHFSDLTVLGSLINLVNLDLSGCEGLRDLTDLSPLAALVKLSSLKLGGCKYLCDLSPLSSLNNLTSLELAFFDALIDIGPLSQLHNLKSLSLIRCEKCIDITSLSGLRKLTHLVVSRFSSLKDLTPLSNLIDLVYLDLSSCGSVSNIGALSSLPKLRYLDISGMMRLKAIDILRGFHQLRQIKHDIHPGIVAEILAYNAVLREDVPFIALHASIWLEEADLFDDSMRNDQERMATTLGAAFSLLENLPAVPEFQSFLDQPEFSPEYEAFLDRHPEFSAEPWRAWLQGSLKNSGFDVMRQRIERVTPESFTPGMIGGICSVFPESDAGEAVQVAWARGMLDKIEDVFAACYHDLLPVSAELCLAYTRLADAEGLERWLDRFTDPSDPAALDPVQEALGRWQLSRCDFDSALAHAASISGCQQRDTLLIDIAQSCVDRNSALAGEILFLIESQEARAKLALELAQNPEFVQQPDNIHRLIVAAGDSPQDLASIIGQLKEHARDELIEELIHLLMMDSVKVKEWRVEKVKTLLGRLITS